MQDREESTSSFPEMYLGSRNKIDFAGELGMGEDGSRCDQVDRGDGRREH